MIFGSSVFLYFFAIGLIVIIVAVRMTRKRGGFFKRAKTDVVAASHGVAARWFDRHPVPTTKKCPKCAEQLALSTLICEACEYNFLSGTIGGRGKILPPSESLSANLAQRA